LMEQIEEAGVHSGDSACVLPAVSLSGGAIERIESAAARLVKAMGAVGLVNIQLAIQGDTLYVLEANPRASRTVPFVSKAIGVPLAKLAAKIMAGRSLRELLEPYWPWPLRPSMQGRRLQPLDDGRLPSPWPVTYSVKEVILPFDRFPGTNILLGPEMRSTGEVMGLGSSFAEAFAKAEIAAGNTLPTEGTVLASLADPDKRVGAALVANLCDLGFDIVATEGTAQALRATGVPVRTVAKVGEGRPDVVDLIAQGRVSLVVNTPSSGQRSRVQSGPPLPAQAEARGLPLPLEGRRGVGHRIRLASLDHHVPYLTTLAALRAATAAIRSLRSGALPVRSLGEILSGQLEA